MVVIVIGYVLTQYFYFYLMTSYDNIYGISQSEDDFMISLTPHVTGIWDLGPGVSPESGVRSQIDSNHDHTIIFHQKFPKGLFPTKIRYRLRGMGCLLIDECRQGVRLPPSATLIFPQYPQLDDCN